MAFRHYQGSVKPITAAWFCPTCHQENLGALEDGCVHCAAGRDAKAASETAAAQRVVEAITQRREERTVAIPAAKVDYPAPPSFVAWWDGVKAEALKLNGYEIARLAYQAGFAVAQLQLGAVRTGLDVSKAVPQASPVENSTGGWVLNMYQDTTKQVEHVDPRTAATILAALAFYRDNQLAYGAIPGQLSAEEVTELVTKLSPQEQEA